MKTNGICHAQSARKHRKAGHMVIELGDGRRYQWFHGFDRVPQMVGRAKRLNGMKATHIIVDEVHSFEDIERVNRAFPIERIAKAFEVPVHLIDGRTPVARIVQSEIKSQDDGGATAEIKIAFPKAEYPTLFAVTHGINVGARFWPKRRNQHSKPYHVLGYMAGTGDVMFTRADPYGPDDVDTMNPDAFLAVIGKRA